MRMVKIKPKPMDLETAMQKFLLVKESQHTGEETMRGYRNCLARFLADSHNSLDYPLLEDDVLTFFAAIPGASPARYNKPFQNINAFLNWALEQELIEKNPIKVHKLHKRRDDGNIKPLPRGQAVNLSCFTGQVYLPSFLKLATFVLGFFHCFQMYIRNLRRSHSSQAISVRFISAASTLYVIVRVSIGRLRN